MEEIRLKNPSGTPMKGVRDLAYLIWKVMYQKAITFSCSNGKIMFMQCDSSRSRSITDLKLIARTYLPDIKLSQVEAAIKKLYNESRGLNHSYCTTVERIVHDPKNVATTLEEVRAMLGNLNVKKNDRALSNTNK